MDNVRIGVPDFISVRPLIFGLVRRSEPDTELVFNAPGVLAAALDRGELEAALVPSIEYLRGVGKYHVDGPALIARAAMGSTVLLVQKPLDEIERIAVEQHCCSPVALLRITLGEIHGVFPDLCVTKNIRGDWRQSYDGVLLAGDEALRFLVSRPDSDVTVHNITDMWDSLSSLPFVHGLWAYNDEGIADQLVKMFVTSRNFGLQNLSLLADGISHTTPYDGEMLHDYFNNCWEYNLSEEAKLGLRTLEEYALRYNLILRGRAKPATVR